jgi:hypothetical protein
MGIKSMTTRLKTVDADDYKLETQMGARPSCQLGEIFHLC